MATRIQFRRDTAADWASFNPTLAEGETGYETDTGKFKIGDGSTPWNSLSYAVTTYDNDDVDTHLNTSTANTSQLLSWSGSDYDWVDAPTGTTKFYTDEPYVASNGLALINDPDFAIGSDDFYFELKFWMSPGNQYANIFALGADATYKTGPFYAYRTNNPDGRIYVFASNNGQGGNGTTMASLYLLGTNKFHNLILARNSGTVSLYFNGERVYNGNPNEITSLTADNLAFFKYADDTQIGPGNGQEYHQGFVFKKGDSIIDVSKTSIKTKLGYTESGATQQTATDGDTYAITDNNRLFVTASATSTDTGYIAFGESYAAYWNSGAWVLHGTGQGRGLFSGQYITNHIASSGSTLGINASNSLYLGTRYGAIWMENYDVFISANGYGNFGEVKLQIDNSDKLVVSNSAIKFSTNTVYSNVAKIGATGDTENSTLTFYQYESNVETSYTLSELSETANPLNLKITTLLNISTDGVERFNFDGNLNNSGSTAADSLSMASGTASYASGHDGGASSALTQDSSNYTSIISTPTVDPNDTSWFVGVWFKSDGTPFPTNACVFGTGYVTNLLFCMATVDDSTTPSLSLADYTSGWTRVVASTQPIWTDWNHYAIQRDGDNLYLFLNGSLVATGSASGDTYPDQWILGRYTGVLAGDYDEWMFIDRAVVSHVNAGFSLSSTTSITNTIGKIESTGDTTDSTLTFKQYESGVLTSYTLSDLGPPANLFTIESSSAGGTGVTDSNVKSWIGCPAASTAVDRVWTLKHNTDDGKVYALVSYTSSAGPNPVMQKYGFGKIGTGDFFASVNNRTDCSPNGSYFPILLISTESYASVDDIPPIGVSADGGLQYLGTEYGSTFTPDTLQEIEIGSNSNATSKGVAIGENANATSYAVAVGQYANSIGTSGVSLGYYAKSGQGVSIGSSSQSGDGSVSIGQNAGQIQSGFNNVLIGKLAGQNGANLHNAININASGTTKNVAENGHMLLTTNKAKIEYTDANGFEFTEDLTGTPVTYDLSNFSVPLQVQDDTLTNEYYIYVGNPANKLSTIQSTRGNANTLTYDQSFATLQEALNFVQSNTLKDVGYNDYRGSDHGAAWVLALEPDADLATQDASGYFSLQGVAQQVILCNQNSLNPVDQTGANTTFEASSTFVIYGCNFVQIHGDMEMPYMQIGRSNIKPGGNYNTAHSTFPNGLSCYDGSTVKINNTASFVSVDTNSYFKGLDVDSVDAQSGSTCIVRDVLGTTNDYALAHVNSYIQMRNYSCTGVFSSLSVRENSKIEITGNVTMDAPLQADDSSNIYIQGNLTISTGGSVQLRTGSEMFLAGTFTHNGPQNCTFGGSSIANTAVASAISASHNLFNDGVVVKRDNASPSYSFFGLPTSNPGVTGQIWNDAGTLKIS